MRDTSPPHCPEGSSMSTGPSGGFRREQQRSEVALTTSSCRNSDFMGGKKAKRGFKSQLQGQ